MKALGLLILLLAVGGCASTPLEKARNDFYSGEYQQALHRLDEDSDQISDRDRLLLYMDRGLILHRLGDFAASNRELLNAADLIESLDQISVSEQISTLAVNEWLANYKGEYSERLWVHTYLMMNFLLLGDAEGAAVEARRSLKVLNQFDDALKEANFTRALNGLSFESAGQINDAYLEYKLLSDVLNDPEPVEDKLLLFSQQLGLERPANIRANSDFIKQVNTDNRQGELIVFLSKGRIPRKIAGNLFLPPDIRFSWPQYTSYQAWPVSVEFIAELNRIPHFEVTTNMGNLARSSLSARGKTLATKQITRAVTKHAIVDEVEGQNPLVGGLLHIALFALEEADTRGWDVLPGQLVLLRVPLSSGVHDLELRDGSDVVAYFPGISIRPGEKVFRSIHF